MIIKYLRFFSRNLVILFTLQILLFATSFVYSANRYCRVSGNWNNTATWSSTSDGIDSASVPHAGDTVFIELGRTVYIDTAYAAFCAFLYIGSTNSGSAQLVFYLNSSLIVSGKVQIGGTEATTPNFADGSIIFAQGSKMTVKGLITIGAADLMSSGSLDFSEGGLLQIGDSIRVYLKGSFKAGQGTIAYIGAAQTVLSSDVVGIYNNLTLSGSGLKTIKNVSVDGILSMEGRASVEGLIAFGPSSTLLCKGSVAQTTGPELGTLIGTVSSFSGSGGLIIDNPNGVSLGSDCGILHSLNLIAGNFNLGSHCLTLYGPAIAGNANNLKTMAASSLNFTTNAPYLILPASITDLKKLSLISTSGLSLEANVNVATLTLLGKITTAEYFLNCDEIDGTPGPLHYIYGKVRHHFTSDRFYFSFPIGDAENYTPVQVALGPVIVEGDLIVSSNPKLHPELSTSGFTVGKIYPIYFSISNMGLVFNKCNITFPYVIAKIPKDANTNTWVVKNYNSKWTSLQISERNSVSIQARDINSFGDFVIGEVRPDAGFSTLTHAFDTIIANGKRSVVFMITAKDGNGNFVYAGGSNVSINKVRGSGSLSSVSDQGNGMYRAILTSPTSKGSGVFEAFINGEPIKNGGSKAFQTEITYIAGPPSGIKSSLALEGSAINTQGNYRQQLKVLARDVNGNLIAKGGAVVVFNRITGSGSIGNVRDNGDGSYTAEISAPLASGSGVFSATVNAEAVQNDTGNTCNLTLNY
ncbi:MAG: Ig-like domain-containing protein [Ferruginibacter sp.]